MKGRNSSFVLVSACLMLASPASSETVREAVEAGNRAFIAAFQRGDAAAIAALYTEDAQVIPPGAPPASGRAAIAGFWQSQIDAGIHDLALDTVDVESAGDLAYEGGVVRLVTSDGKTASARYVVVWKRSRGAWRLHRDIWNSAD